MELTVYCSDCNSFSKVHSENVHLPSKTAACPNCGASIHISRKEPLSSQHTEAHPSSGNTSASHLSAAIVSVDEKEHSFPSIESEEITASLSNPSMGNTFDGAKLSNNTSNETILLKGLSPRSPLLDPSLDTIELISDSSQKKAPINISNISDIALTPLNPDAPHKPSPEDHPPSSTASSVLNNTTNASQSTIPAALVKKRRIQPVSTEHTTEIMDTPVALKAVGSEDVGVDSTPKQRNYELFETNKPKVHLKQNEVNAYPEKAAATVNLGEALAEINESTADELRRTGTHGALTLQQIINKNLSQPSKSIPISSSNAHYITEDQLTAYTSEEETSPLATNATHSSKKTHLSKSTELFEIYNNQTHSNTSNIQFSIDEHIESPTISGTHTGWLDHLKADLKQSNSQVSSATHTVPPTESSVHHGNLASSSGQNSVFDILSKKENTGNFDAYNSHVFKSFDSQHPTRINKRVNAMLSQNNIATVKAKRIAKEKGLSTRVKIGTLIINLFLAFCLLAQYFIVNQQLLKGTFVYQFINQQMCHIKQCLYPLQSQALVVSPLEIHPQQGVTYVRFKLTNTDNKVLQLPDLELLADTHYAEQDKKTGRRLTPPDYLKSDLKTVRQILPGATLQAELGLNYTNTAPLSIHYAAP